MGFKIGSLWVGSCDKHYELVACYEFSGTYCLQSLIPLDLCPCNGTRCPSVKSCHIQCLKLGMLRPYYHAGEKKPLVLSLSTTARAQRG